MRSKNMNNGGIAGSGIFGLIGTTIRCDADDDSMYCIFMKFVNVIFMVCLLLYVAYVAYQVFGPMLFKRKRL